MNQHEENALRIHIEKLEKENEAMKALATQKGFYDTYFKYLKNEKTNNDAFNKVNDEYNELFGSYRYSCYDTFRNATKNLLKTKK